MQELIINHPKLKVWQRTGTEGPRHDPYGYEELEARTPEGSIILHSGLMDWLKQDKDATITAFDKAAIGALRRRFEQHAGFTIEQLFRFHRKLSSRCRKCGSTEFVSVRGYPGEHFEICAKCNSVVSSFFCLSEVL
jgi:hypothetical protein